MKTLPRFVVFLAVFTLLSGSLFAGDVRAAYDRYIAAYSAYQEGIRNHLEEGEVKALLNDYLRAKSAYEVNFQSPSTASSRTDIIPKPSVTGDSLFEASVAEAITGSATSQVSSLPPTLQRILEGLWGPDGTKNPDFHIKLLEQYIASYPRSEFAAMARYELAKACEFLKNDLNKAELVLNQLQSDPLAGSFAHLAANRIKYIQSLRQQQQLKSEVNKRYYIATNAYQSYYNTSWLAFPVKMTRWTGYLGKLLDFNRKQNNLESYQLVHEAISSPFIPPVSVIFDTCDPAQGAFDPQAPVALHYRNSEAWYSRWKIINDAQSSIDVQYFILEKDIFGLALQGALLRKAREGLNIRLMMDARGTKKFTRQFLGQSFVQELAAFPNVEVTVFNPVNRNVINVIFDVRKLMASNHDKIVVVDDEYSIIGGRNVSMNYFVDPEDYPAAYRDCDVVIHSGEVARQLSLALEEEFQVTKSEPITGRSSKRFKQMDTAFYAMDSYIKARGFYTPPKDIKDKDVLNCLREYNNELAEYRSMKRYRGFDPMENSLDCSVKIIDKHSLSGPRTDLTDELIRYIDGARSEIVIQNPYVVLTDRIFAALKRAAIKGTPIIIHTNSPKSTDSIMTQAMFYNDWQKILKEIPTCRIFTFDTEQKLHAKNFVFDNKVSVVGTYNLDYLSEQVNSEVAAIIKSEEFAGQLRSGIMEDIGKSKEYLIEILDDGSTKVIYGPDDLPGKKMWLLKTLSKIQVLRPLI